MYCRLRQTARDSPEPLARRRAASVGCLISFATGIPPFGQQISIGAMRYVPRDAGQGRRPSFPHRSGRNRANGAEVLPGGPSRGAPRSFFGCACVRCPPEARSSDYVSRGRRLAWSGATVDPPGGLRVSALSALSPVLGAGHGSTETGRCGCGFESASRRSCPTWSSFSAGRRARPSPSADRSCKWCCRACPTMCVPVATSTSTSQRGAGSTRPSKRRSSTIRPSRPRRLHRGRPRRTRRAGARPARGTRGRPARRERRAGR